MSKRKLPSEKLPSDFLPPFSAYYDTGRKYYWIQNARDGWIEVTETSLRRHLRAAGISPNIPDAEIISPLDCKLIGLQAH